METEAKPNKVEGSTLSLRPGQQSDVQVTEPTSLYGFVEAWNKMTVAVHATAVEHGFYDGGAYNKGEKIALMHSELSELLEAERKDPNQPSEKIPAFKLTEEELADAVIRIMDYAHHNGLNVGGAIVAKAAYNDGRPYKHGKRF